MADQKKITEYQQVPGSLENVDEFVVYDISAGTTRKCDLEQVLEQPTAHAANNVNPHSVTNSQVGLDAVNNLEQLSKAANLSDIPDPATARANLGVGASGDLGLHLADIANPHLVTKTQTGLGNVTDDAQCKIASNLADVADAAIARANLNAALDTDVSNHLADTNNPHVVTRDQLGVRHSHSWYIEGVLAVLTDVGGVWIAPRALTIAKIFFYCKTPGSAGSTIVDVNLNGITIFTTQANRPELQWDDVDQKVESVVPDVTAVAEGDIISLDIDQISIGPADLSAIIICK